MSPAAPRLRSDFWVAAYLRRANAHGAAAVLRRRGAAEAGAVFIRIDRLDGSVVLLGPAPQSEAGDSGDRLFAPLHRAPTVTVETAEDRLTKELRFDPDAWVVDVEDRRGRFFLSDADEDG